MRRKKQGNLNSCLFYLALINDDDDEDDDDDDDGWETEEELDDDHDLDYEIDHLSESESSSDFTEDEQDEKTDRMFLVCEGQMRELFRFFIKCGSLIEDMREIKNTGLQHNLRFSCNKGCQYDWNSQSDSKHVKGMANLYLTAGITFSGIIYFTFCTLFFFFYGYIVYFSYIFSDYLLVRLFINSFVKSLFLYLFRYTFPEI